MEAAKRDIFSLDERWQLAREGFSTELSKQIVWLSGLMTFAQVSEVLQQVGQVYVPVTTVWEQVNWHGQRVQDSVQRQREQVSVERTRWEQRHYDAHLYRSIALDGGMVHLRGEGWKELESMSAHLFRGEIFRIVSDLHQHGCAPQAAYFVTHQRRMQYAAFRADGYPIGSGGIESAVKQFKQRLTGAGMRWSRAGAERMVCIRSAVLTHSLDALWQSAA